MRDDGSRSTSASRSAPIAADHPTPAVGTACTGGTRPRGLLAQSGSTRRSSGATSARGRLVGRRSPSCGRPRRTGHCRRRPARGTPAPSRLSAAWCSYRKSTRASGNVPPIFGRGYRKLARDLRGQSPGLAISSTHDVELPRPLRKIFFLGAIRHQPSHRCVQRLLRKRRDRRYRRPLRSITFTF